VGGSSQLTIIIALMRWDLSASADASVTSISDRTKILQAQIRYEAVILYIKYSSVYPSLQFGRNV